MPGFGHGNGYKVYPGLHSGNDSGGVATTAVLTTLTGATLESRALRDSDSEDSGPRT